jgi:hypothetical protein
MRLGKQIIVEMQEDKSKKGGGDGVRRERRI